jgi:argininosuccinate lyase
MPQKRNADLLELVRGKAARLIGNATALMTTVKGLPLAYNKDLQETQEPLFEAAETMLAVVPLVTGWMRAAQFDPERMQSAVGRGFMNAWAAATYLVRQGVAFRLAHEQIGKAVQYCIEQGCELGDLTLEQLREFSDRFQDDFYDCLKLESVLGIHDVPGGTAPARVRQAIEASKLRLTVMRGLAHANA